MNIQDEIWITVTKLPSFATYSNDSLETSSIVFSEFIGEDDIGVYAIQVSVTDQHQASTEYYIDLEVGKPFVFAGVVIEEENEVEEEIEKVEEVKDVKAKPLTAKIDSISQNSNLTIKFSERIRAIRNLTMIQEAMNLTLLPHSLPEEFDIDLI